MMFGKVNGLMIVHFSGCKDWSLKWLTREIITRY